MSNVENHMDDLFKRAAEDYPLKASVGNWDSLLPMLEAEAPLIASTAGNKRNRNFSFLMVTLFIATGIALPLIINNPFKQLAYNKSISENVMATKKVNDYKDRNENKNPVIENVNAFSGSKNSETKTVLSKRKFTSAFSSNPVIVKSNLQTKNEHVEIIEEEKKSDVRFLETSGNVDELVKVETINKNIFSDSSSIKKSLAVTETDDKNAEEIKDEMTKKIKAKFYFGLSAGIDQSIIKNQGNTKPGLNTGFIAGLQINEQFAVETGIQLVQKKYYTDGKYFQPKQGSMPSNMTVESMYGTSTLIEIPVNVKFNFSRKNNTFYATTGFSSYLMTKERNKYSAVVSGQQQQINSTYTSMDKYMISMFDLSIGYQHALHKNINFRIEPYLQIPLKGLGIGDLPVSSRGIHIIISQRKK